MTPRKSILNPAFRYRKAVETNVALTFARERKRLAEAAAGKAGSVVAIRKAKP